MKKIFFLLVLILSLSQAHAQMNRGDNRGQMGNTQMDRRVGAGQYGNGNVTKRDKVDIVETSVANLKEKLTLDGFQEAIVRNLIKDNQSQSKEIIESTSFSDMEKRDLLTSLGEKFNVDIKKLLSSNQLVAYDKLITKKK